MHNKQTKCPAKLKRYVAQEKILIVVKYLKRKGDDPAAEVLLKRLQSEGIDALKTIYIERVFRLEGISEEDGNRLHPLLCDAVVEKIADSSQLDPSRGAIFEVGYQRAVTDPELPSILRGARALGVKTLEWARISHRYQFIGIAEEHAKKIVEHYLYNPQVQHLIHENDEWTTLKPQGEAGPVEKISLKGLNTDELARLSDERRLFLNKDQMASLQQIEENLGRSLNDAEVEMFAQTWSDHCFHTTWKSLGLLKMLQESTRKINHPLVLSMFEDNAGVMAFYDGWALTVKGETHNSPSAVSPYGGIMTKHGGVIRDTLGCGRGAWPIGGSTIMGLGDPRMAWKDVPAGALHPRTILLESIKGTADYCNPMGIPMMFPVYRFHPGYTGKCLALGHSIGLIPEKDAPKGRPEPGDFAILFGGRTGRDGLHGATVSSDSMTHNTAEVDAAHVQIGHPIEERKFMEAIPELRDKDCVRAITDLGAAGLSSAAGEMGSDTGIFVNLAQIKLKTEGMRPWEIWISESQERMLLCCPPEKKDESLAILKRFETEAMVIGRFTDTRRCQVVYNPGLAEDEVMKDLASAPDSVVVDLAFSDLRKGCPLPDFHPVQPKMNVVKAALPEESNESLTKAARKVLSHINICDQSPAGAQFDSTVQGNTVVGPYAADSTRMPNDVWIAAPVRGKPFGVLTSLAFNPFYGQIHAGKMTELMIIEALSKQIAAGVRLEDIVLCDNFYTPRVTSEVAGALLDMVGACCRLSEIFGTPFISGKDSSSGTFVSEDGKRIDVSPTLCVMAMGRMPDVNRAAPKPFRKAGNQLMIAGPVSEALGASIYLDTMGIEGGSLADSDPETMKVFWKKYSELQAKGLIRSVSVLGEGGLLRRLFEMSLGSGLGCDADLTGLQEKLKTTRTDAALFSEMIGAMLVEVEEKDVPELVNTLDAVPVGSVSDTDRINISSSRHRLSLNIESLKSDWEKPFREFAI